MKKINEESRNKREKYRNKSKAVKKEKQRGRGRRKETTREGNTKEKEDGIKRE